jgi:integrase
VHRCAGVTTKPHEKCGPDVAPDNQAMPGKRLTDRTLKSLRPAKPGQRYDRRDRDVPGFLVRVTDRGVRTFMLQTRYPGGSGQPTRRALGIYPAISLEKARAKAVAWRDLIAAGIDPALAEEDARRAEIRRHANSFASVADAFVAHCRRQEQRKADEVERDLQVEFVSQWGARPITSIASADVREVIEAKVDQGHRAQAHNLLGTLRRLFNWALGTDAYGLEKSPCDRLRPRDLIGVRAIRDRVLSDRELLAFWRATAHLGDPYGPLFRLLALTIQRKSEVAEAVRSEVDLHRHLWTIPKERMKSDAAHVVPLAPMAAEIFKSLPTLTQGPHLFTTTLGAKPVNGFSKAKARLDALMRDEIKRIAEAEGEDPSSVTLKNWVIHDLRRTGRTHLSALPVPDLVRELVIAHRKPGLHRVYDQYAYIDEKRRALDLWENQLRGIVEPVSYNVG